MQELFNEYEARVELAISAARNTLEIEIAALKDLSSRFEPSARQALELLFNCRGRVVVTGLGKSGLIGAKISATFASTGTPSFFLHSTDALHGDSGALAPGDVLLAISNSGETAEVCAFAQLMSDFGVQVLAMTGSKQSTLAKIANGVLDISTAREADPLNLAPTSSTTVTLALGDAIACALMAARNFTPQEFAHLHPAGALGKKSELSEFIGKEP
jgi:arabinose-5-phosphate isomerase